MTFEGTVRIDGKFTGEIQGEGVLVIGEKGVVRADIQAGVVMVHGETHGTIQAKERIEAYTPAKIYGNLHSPILVFGEGVIFQGTSRMADEAQEEKASDAPEKKSG